MANANKLIITNFTDPMMGLSYESEPFFRKLETHFEDRLEMRFVMSGLVRDVYDWVDPADLQHGKEFALEKYNARLAKIYEAEECITGMPINMAGFQLFTTEHTSSTPLNLAYKAAQIVDENKSALFLYNMRFATIVDCRPTNRLDEILKVVKITGLSTQAFIEIYEDGRAQTELNKDFALKQAFGVTTRPSYLFEYAGKKMMATGVLNYANFLAAIEKITDGELKEVPPDASIVNIRHLISRHPLISPIEIKEAFGVANVHEVRQLIEPLLYSGEISIEDVPHGWFIRKA